MFKKIIQIECFSMFEKISAGSQISPKQAVNSS